LEAQKAAGNRHVPSRNVQTHLDTRQVASVSSQATGKKLAVVSSCFWWHERVFRGHIDIVITLRNVAAMIVSMLALRS
jgi:hypothetical protein